MAKNNKSKGIVTTSRAENDAKANPKLTQARVPRNPFAMDPLMRKSGAHQKSKSSERAKANRETQRQARDWSR